MTDRDRNLILQSCAFAQVFLKEADRASAGQSSATHEAAAQLRAALNNLPPAIEGCICRCTEFNAHGTPWTQETVNGLSFGIPEVEHIDFYKQTPDGFKLIGSAPPTEFGIPEYPDDRIDIPEHDGHEGGFDND